VNPYMGITLVPEGSRNWLHCLKVAQPGDRYALRIVGSRKLWPGRICQITELTTTGW
jgi:hypothetical protein